MHLDRICDTIRRLINVLFQLLGENEITRFLIFLITLPCLKYLNRFIVHARIGFRNVVSSKLRLNCTSLPKFKLGFWNIRVDGHGTLLYHSEDIVMQNPRVSGFSRGTASLSNIAMHVPMSR
jgi:hypothetical protein